MIFKNLSKVSFLKDIKSIILLISSNFYTKIKVIYIEIKYLKPIFKMLFEVINISYKFTGNKKVININNNNYFFSNED